MLAMVNGIFIHSSHSFIGCLLRFINGFSSQDNPVTGKKADVMVAAQKALEVALRLVKPGNSVSMLLNLKIKGNHTSIVLWAIFLLVLPEEAKS